MRKRAIGDTGLAVTEIGFGAGPISSMPDTYGYSVDEETAYAAIRSIFDGPVNVLDTSRNYGLGRSEERIGAVIREWGGLPDGFVLCTKLDRDIVTGSFDAARARRSFEESLEALGVDRVQILHLHDPEYATDLREVTRRKGAIDELFRIKQESLADAVGIAMGRLDIMLPLIKDWPFDIVLNHNRFTLLNRSADELFNLAAEAGMSIFNAAPYAGGVLAKGSTRSPRITYQEASDGMLEPVCLIEAICHRHSVPISAAALQFSISDPRMTSTIVGVLRKERLAETMVWADMLIPDPVWSDLKVMIYFTSDPEINRVYRSK